MGMDYILGRNAIDQSYVTGYGERPLENPYHRFWCHQANPKYPPPPPGVLSGGPNSGFEDPYVQSAGLSGCAPQKCFVDNVEAWSTNEVTINWNAPLFWVAAYLDEKEGPKPAAPPRARRSNGFPLSRPRRPRERAGVRVRGHSTFDSYYTGTGSTLKLYQAGSSDVLTRPRSPRRKRSSRSSFPADASPLPPAPLVPPPPPVPAATSAPPPFRPCAAIGGSIEKLSMWNVTGVVRRPSCRCSAARRARRPWTDRSRSPACDPSPSSGC